MTARAPAAATPAELALVPFRKRVLEYVTEQSGFRFERTVAAAFAAAGFQTAQGALYIDPLSGQHRELDVLAWHEGEAGEVTFRVSFHVECKSSANDPWVVFRPRWGGGSLETTHRRHFHIAAKGTLPMLNRAAMVHRQGQPKGAETRELQLLAAARGLGVRLRVASKKSSQEDVAHKAVLGVLHAAIASTRAAEELHREGLPAYELAVPVVVIAGPLFACDLDDAAEPDVTPLVAAR